MWANSGTNNPSLSTPKSPHCILAMSIPSAVTPFPYRNIINQPWREDRISHRSCYLDATAKLPSYEPTVI